MGIFSDLAAEWDEANNPFYSFPPDVVFQASVAAGANLKWTIQQVDGASRTITFIATKNPLLTESSIGLISVFVIPEEANGIAGSRLRTSGTAGDNYFEKNEFSAAVNGALMDMGLYDEKSAPEATPPRTSPLPSSGQNPFSQAAGKTQTQVNNPESIASDLAEIVKLFESGALTDEEFKQAKAKLLS